MHLVLHGMNGRQNASEVPCSYIALTHPGVCPAVKSRGWTAPQRTAPVQNLPVTVAAHIHVSFEIQPVALVKPHHAYKQGKLHEHPQPSTAAV